METKIEEKPQEKVELLKEEGIEINKQLANTIQMLAYENFETVKEKGIKELTPSNI